jgi:hypothetical protein
VVENMVKFRIWFPRVSIFVSWKLITNVSMEVSISFTRQIGAVLRMKLGGAAGAQCQRGLAALRERYKALQMVSLALQSVTTEGEVENRG